MLTILNVPMKEEIHKNAEGELNPQHKYYSIRHYKSVSGKWNDIRAKKSIVDNLRRLGRSGIPAWKILEAILAVIDERPEFKQQIINRIEERY